MQMLIAGIGKVWGFAWHFPTKRTHGTPQVEHPPPSPSHWWAGDMLPLSTGVITAVLHAQARDARESHAPDRARSREIARDRLSHGRT